MQDRKNKREFILEIKNEKAVKVVRIMYPKAATDETDEQKTGDSLLNQQVVQTKLIL